MPGARVLSKTRIARAFLLTVGRVPDDPKREAARRFLEAQPSRYPGLDRPRRTAVAWTDFCQMLLASNAFLYVE